MKKLDIWGYNKICILFVLHYILCNILSNDISVTCRVLNKTVGGFPRPLMNLSAANFAKVFDDAFGYSLVPPFDPYRDSLNFMLASYLIPYVGLVAYVGTNPHINGYRSKRVRSNFNF